MNLRGGGMNTFKTRMRWAMVCLWMITVISLTMPVRAEDSPEAENVAEPETVETAPPSVIIGELNWTGATAVQHIMKWVIEEKLGIPVEFAAMAQPALWAALDKGTVDVYPDMWMPNQKHGFEKYVKERKSVVVKLSYDNAVEGIYMPAQIAKEYDIKEVSDLKGLEQMFDTNGNGKGEMWVGPFDWIASEIYMSKIREYGLDFEPMVVQQWLFLAMLKESMQKEKPIVFYYWEPEWPMAVYDLVRLKEPEYDPAKYIHVRGKPEETHVSCASPPASVYVGVSKQLYKRHPKAFYFLMNWYIPIDEVSKMIAEIEEIPDNPQTPPEQVARRWVENHPKIVEDWLKGIEIEK